jgi:DNA polymerase IV
MDNALEHQGFCRDCLGVLTNRHVRCPTCHGPRLLFHPEIHRLTIAHLDCDAFYASVEKRDRPELRDVPVIVGGATRGVVSTACYIARVKGVKSAMPMFKAMKLCPDAVVVPPDMKKYVGVSREVSALMQELTPAVESISIDEAFLDLGGTSRLHGHSAAISLALLQKTIEERIGISASVGLSYNKFLAKVASDLSKPRGFSIIGKTEAVGFLAKLPVGTIWGVGHAMRESLGKDGISLIGQLQQMQLPDLMKRYGAMGSRLYHLSRGQDRRQVSNEGEIKSVSSETTFDTDIASHGQLEAILWRQCERVAKRAKAGKLQGVTVTLKLKTADFRSRTRSETVDGPTCLAHRIFEIASPLLRLETTGQKFRLLGVGISNLSALGDEISHPSLDQKQVDLDKAELAMDKIRKKFGDPAVVRGLALKERRKI